MTYEDFLPLFMIIGFIALVAMAALWLGRDDFDEED